MAFDRANILSSLLWPSLALILASCGDDGELEIDPNPIGAPTRSAVQDRAIRTLLADVGESRLCDVIEGRLVPLQGPDAPTGADAGLAKSIGRLWVESCRVERQGPHLSVAIGGRGWTWADERRGGPLGSTFAVRGFLRFQVDVSVEGDVDLGYSEPHKVATLWFSPTGPPSSQMSLLGEIPVQAQGGWSGLIGTVGEILGGPLTQQARPVVSRYGASLVSSRLSRGFTATTDLCSGQADFVLGALGDGQMPRRPYPEEELPWLTNERSRLYPGGIEVAGPWSTDSDSFRLDIELEAGPRFEARLFCESQARLVIEAFLLGRPSPLVEELRRESIELGQTHTLELDRTSCPVVLVATPNPQAEEPAEFRFRALDPNASPVPLINCN